MSKDNIPELTDIVGYAKDINEIKSPLDDSISNKTLSQTDLGKLQKKIDTLIKNKISTHNQLLYKEISTEVRQLLQNTANKNE